MFLLKRNLVDSSFATSGPNPYVYIEKAAFCSLVAPPSSFLAFAGGNEKLRVHVLPSCARSTIDYDLNHEALNPSESGSTYYDRALVFLSGGSGSKAVDTGIFFCTLIQVFLPQRW